VVGLVLVNVILLSRITGKDRSPVTLVQAGVDRGGGGPTALTDRGELDALKVTEIGVPHLHSAGLGETHVREATSDLSVTGTPLESVTSDPVTDSNTSNSGSDKNASQGEDPVEGEDPKEGGNPHEGDEQRNPHEGDEQGNPHEGDEGGISIAALTAKL
jgi:hypothetical protein